MANTKVLQNYIDEYGFPVHFHKGEKDVGDSINRWGLLRISEHVTGIKLLPNPVELDLDKVLFPLTNEYVRHPDSDSVFGRPGTLTRDQFIPMFVATALHKKRVHKNNMALGLFKRCGVFWNRINIAGEPKPWFSRDVASFGTWSTVIKAYPTLSILLYPLLCIMDLIHVVQAIVLCVRGHFNKRHTTDDIAFQVNLVWGQLCVAKTPTIYLARYIYAAFRPPSSDGKGNLMGTYGPYSAFRSYFRHEGAPPIDVHWLPVIGRYV